jgi:hypothetical protein
MANERKHTEAQQALGMPAWAEPEPPREYRYERWLVKVNGTTEAAGPSSSEKRDTTHAVKTRAVNPGS